MSLRAFDLFKVGLGPGSPPAVGPMRAARLNALSLREAGADVKAEYKETSRGGLAVDVVEC
jgi:hypothetical protein